MLNMLNILVQPTDYATSASRGVTNKEICQEQAYAYK